MSHRFASVKDRLAVALDVTGVDAARRLLDQIGDEVGIVKIGYQLAYSGGFTLMEELSRAGKQVFADLKLFDIDQTVAHGVRSVAQVGVRFLTIHAYPKTMRAAMASLEGKDAPTLLAVTVLTSMDDKDLREAGYQDRAADLVAKRAVQARQAGIPGLVCSAREVVALRGHVGSDMLLVTPGIRFAHDASGDQKRIMTPDKAIALGSDILVIGRPITASTDPRAAAQRALEAMEVGLERRTDGLQTA
ncbi:MAG: orotidine-5'-phosphate decarboxylase [Pseudomonadota bacterium]